MDSMGGDVSQSSLASTPGNVVGEEARRSTRIERSVPLIIFGQNRMGEPFVERTVSVSINLHGCRYPSRHDYGVGSCVTLHGVGPPAKPEPRLAEVATFPSPSPAASKTQPPRELAAPKPQRVVITSDGLVTALQGKLQQAAEKAAQAAVAKYVDEAVPRALRAIEE